MASFVASRSIFRSSSARNAAARLASQPKIKANKPSTASCFPSPTKNSHSAPIFRRRHVELSFAVESMMPYYTATASALLTSMLSVSRHSSGCLPEAGNDDH